MTWRLDLAVEAGSLGSKRGRVHPCRPCSALCRSQCRPSQSDKAVRKVKVRYVYQGSALGEPLGSNPPRTTPIVQRFHRNPSFHLGQGGHPMPSTQHVQPQGWRGRLQSRISLLCQPLCLTLPYYCTLFDWCSILCYPACEVRTSPMSPVIMPTAWVELTP